MYVQQDLLCKHVTTNWRKNLRSSRRQRCSIRKSVLRNFAKFTRKHMYQSLFFNKIEGLCQSLFFNKGLRPATLLKKRLVHRCFPVNFAKFLTTPSLATEHLWTTVSETWISSWFHSLFHLIKSNAKDRLRRMNLTWVIESRDKFRAAYWVKEFPVLSFLLFHMTTAKLMFLNLTRTFYKTD